MKFINKAKNNNNKINRIAIVDNIFRIKFLNYASSLTELAIKHSLIHKNAYNPTIKIITDNY